MEKPWIEEIFKNGLKWTVVANYDSKGNKRDPGTLKEGNGTLILYDDDVTVREVSMYKNGVLQK
jgi:antitoxin component YwqK of YwqJK toxin-antitoxin module